MDWGILAARCQRFYAAGDPLVWWNMPLSQLAVFLAEIEPLEAAESLRMLNIMRLAQSDKDNGDARLLIRSWENQAGRLGRVEEPEEAKPSKAEYFAMIGRMGLNKA